MQKILFTGPPGCGQSTLIERIIEEYPAASYGEYARKLVQRIETPATGFFT